MSKYVVSLPTAITACVLAACGASSTAQRAEYSSVHRNAEQVLPQTVTGGATGLRASLQASRVGVSLVVGDFDSDGVQDLITGYATARGGALLLQRGSPVALAPTAHEFAMIQQGELVAPYVASAEAIELPVRPDLIKTADIHGHGHLDLLVAQQGGSSVYLLLGDGRGGFSSPQAMPVAGTIRSLTTWRSRTGEDLIVAGVCGASGCGLQFLDTDGVTKAFVGTPSAVTAIETGDVDNGLSPDFALIAGGRVLVLDGDTALSARPTLETLPLANAAALALGSFVFDRRAGLQVAVLDSAATLHVMARGGVDSIAFTTADRIARNRASLARAGSQPQAPGLPVKRTGAWTEVENVPNVGPGGTAAVMLRGRLSGGGGDDLAVLAGSQYVTVAHPLSHDGAMMKTTPVVTIDSTAAPVTAALATRISADARHGIVALSSGTHPLTVTPPGANRTMTADTFTDAVVTAAAKSACINKTPGCTLRAAVTVANDDQAATGAGTSTIDTILLNAGTYTISGTAANVGHGNLTAMNPDYYGDVNYHFQVDASMNFVGAGCTVSGTPGVPTACSSIVNGNGKDQVFTINYATYYATSIKDSLFTTIDVFFSGLTIENGTNPNNPNSTTCMNDDTCNFYGGNIGYVATGAANLVMNNVLITGGNSPYYNGGAIDIGYTSGSPGPVEIDHSSITSNSVAPSSGGDGGGGISVDEPVPLILTSDLLSGNTSPGFGGALYAFPQGSSAVTISDSLFTNNISSTDFGGAIAAFSTLSMGGTTLTNNKATAYGGGLYLANGANSASITTSTFTSNSLTSSYTGGGVTYTADGAGVCIAPSATSGQAVVSLQYSRFHGNTGGTATGLSVGCNDTNTETFYATVTAKDDWWGCNPTTSTGSIAGIGCDTAHVGNASNGTLTVSPYTTLTLGLSSTPVIQGATVTATASLGQDSAGTIFIAANDAAYLATPIAEFTLSDTGTVTYNPSATAFSSSAATATSFAAATATGATNTSGTGTATLTVDGQTLTKTYTITAPADLTVSSSHTGNFKAGDTADTYILTATNSGGTATSGTVTVTDTLPSGFTVVSLAGTGWTCTPGSLTCTRSDALAAGSSYSAITLTVSVTGADIGTYTNTVTVSGGGEVNTSNDTGTDSTIVVGAPTILEAFSPTTVAPNVNSTVTFTVGNPSANTVSLTGVAFGDTLPTGLRVSSPNVASTTCAGGTVSAAAGGGSVSLSGATIAPGATCTVSVNVVSSAIGSYPNTTGPVTATNAGGTASATLTVSVTPTRLVYTATPATPITAGGNAGTVMVALEDAAGNIATNNSTAVVILTVSGPSSYSQTYMGMASNGVATFSSLGSVVLTVAGTYTYTASATGLSSAVATEVVNPGAAASFTVSGLSTFTAPQMSGTAIVTARDTYGNVATGFTGTVTLSSTDATATFSPASYTYTAADAGSHAFTVTFNTAGTQTLTATSGAVMGSETSILVEDAIVILNTNSTLVRLTDAGVETTAFGAANGTSATYGAVAFDNTGDIWSASQANAGVQEYTKAGAGITVAGNAAAGVNAPVSLFIDGAGQVWVANGNSTVSVLSNAGAAITPTTGYQGGGLSTPSGIVVDSSGSVWLTNRGNNSVTKIFGAAAPVVTPTVTGTTNNTLGTRP